MKKILIPLVLLFVASFAFQGCEKGKQCNYIQSNPTSEKLSNSFRMSVDYKNIHSEYVGEDINEPLLWSRFDNETLTNRSYIIFALEDFKNAKYEFKDSVLYITNDYEVIQLSNFSFKDNLLQFKAMGYNKIPVYFSMYSNKYDLSQYQINTKVHPIVWYLIYGAACLIATGIEYYCDNKIVEDVNRCTKNGLCSKVHSCSAECLKCPQKN